MLAAFQDKNWHKLQLENVLAIQSNKKIDKKERHDWMCAKNMHAVQIWQFEKMLGAIRQFFNCADSETRRSCLDGLANQCHVIIDKCSDASTCKDVFALQTSADQMLMLVVEKNQIALV